MLTYPDTLTPALADALGFMNFRTGPIAHLLRAAGHDIAPKAEAEQAYVLDMLVRAVCEHGDNWRQPVEAKLREAREEASRRSVIAAGA